MDWRALWLAPIVAAGIAVSPAAAQATDGVASPAPALRLDIRNTLDLWRNLQGGQRRGDTMLDKLQVGVSLDGDRLNRPGFTARAEAFKTNGESFSGSRTGDLQTASNIEALGVIRLSQFWAQQQVGSPGNGGLAARVGLLDLNATFDSIGAAGLFLNSSHGVGPDLSHSGRNGPSIFPVTAAGGQAVWTPTRALTLNAGIFDGVPGDPSHPRRFAAARLGHGRGALLITQADYKFAADAQASVGVWGYTARSAAISAPGRMLNPRPGAYGFVDVPAPALGPARAWMRVGVADGRTQTVAGYLGGGVVWTGLLPRRTEDQLGLAVAHAVIGRNARRSLGLPSAETSLEATYSVRVSRFLQLQPDLQYIVHPGLAGHVPNAVAAGLRIVATLQQPAGLGGGDN